MQLSGHPGRHQDPHDQPAAFSDSTRALRSQARLGPWNRDFLTNCRGPQLGEGRSHSAKHLALFQGTFCFICSRNFSSLILAVCAALLALGTGCSEPADTGVPGGFESPTGSSGPFSPGTAGPGGAATGTAGPGASAPGGVGAPATDPSSAGPGAITPGTEPGGQVADPNAILDEVPPSTLVPTPRMARLSRKQWSNTVRDLLQLADISDIDAEVPADALLNFDSEIDALYVTEQLRLQLATAAERLADRVTGDPAALSRLIPSDAPTELASRARAFVTSFGMRAFRRPLTEEEVTTHLGLFDQGPTLYPDLDALSAGVSLVIQAMLQSPHFLYRTELTTAEPGASQVALGDYEVASKLAFALTNTMPDEELFAAAAAGKLRERADVVAQAQRLLAGPSGSAGIANFNFQVYRLGTYDGIVRDPAVFPTFTEQTPAAMRQEVQLFFDWIFQQGMSVRDVYTSAVGFVNSDLAPVYGLDGDFSRDVFTQVNLDPNQRAGFLTQAGFLSSYISDTEPDIIHRGVFIATRLLCITLPPPDPKAGALIDIQPGMTNRARVEATTGKGTCGEGCHSALLNPLGYAFENYDAVGKYRVTDQGLPVVASDSYTLDGAVRNFENGVELSHLLSESKQLHKCYTQNLMSYLHGRATKSEDGAMIDYYARLSRAGMISVRDLALNIVTSDTFLTRLP